MKILVNNTEAKAVKEFINSTGGKLVTGAVNRFINIEENPKGLYIHINTKFVVGGINIIKNKFVPLIHMIDSMFQLITNDSEIRNFREQWFEKEESETDILRKEIKMLKMRNDAMAVQIRQLKHPEEIRGHILSVQKKDVYVQSEDLPSLVPVDRAMRTGVAVMSEMTDSVTSHKTVTVKTIRGSQVFTQKLKSTVPNTGMLNLEESWDNVRQQLVRDLNPRCIYTLHFYEPSLPTGAIGVHDLFKGYSAALKSAQRQIDTFVATQEEGSLSVVVDFEKFI